MVRPSTIHRRLQSAKQYAVHKQRRRDLIASYPLLSRQHQGPQVVCSSSTTRLLKRPAEPRSFPRRLVAIDKIVVHEARRWTAAGPAERAWQTKLVRYQTGARLSRPSLSPVSRSLCHAFSSSSRSSQARGHESVKRMYKKPQRYKRQLFPSYFTHNKESREATDLHRRALNLLSAGVRRVGDFGRSLYHDLVVLLRRLSDQLSTVLPRLWNRLKRNKWLCLLLLPPELMLLRPGRSLKEGDPVEMLASTASEDEESHGAHSEDDEYHDVDEEDLETASSQVGSRSFDRSSSHLLRHSPSEDAHVAARDGLIALSLTSKFLDREHFEGSRCADTAEKRRATVPLQYVVRDLEAFDQVRYPLSHKALAPTLALLRSIQGEQMQARLRAKEQQRFWEDLDLIDLSWRLPSIPPQSRVPPADLASHGARPLPAALPLQQDLTPALVWDIIVARTLDPVLKRGEKRLDVDRVYRGLLHWTDECASALDLTPLSRIVGRSLEGGDLGRAISSLWPDLEERVAILVDEQSGGQGLTTIPFRVCSLSGQEDLAPAPVSEGERQALKKAVVALCFASLVGIAAAYTSAQMIAIAYWSCTAVTMRKIDHPRLAQVLRRCYR